MIGSLTRLAGLLQTLFLCDAERLARETGFVRRGRQLGGSAFARALVFTWLDQPGASLEVLAANAAELGADVCPQAIDNRLTARAVDFFERLLCAGLDYAFQADAAPPPLLGRFEGVYAFDTTHVALPAALAAEWPGHGGAAPGDGAAACAVQVLLELSGQGVVEAQVGPGTTNDLAFELAHTALPPGALRLADRGFCDLGLFASYAAEGVYWISRPHPLTFVADDPAPGPAGKLWDYLRPQRGWRVDRWVYLGKQRLPARLIAVRLPEEEAERRRRKLRLRRKKGEGPPSAAQEGLCEWDVSVTNVPEGKASAEEVISLRRLRWQIELLFKLFKSVGGVGLSAGRRRERVLVELYAKLLGQLVRGWALLRLCGPALAWSHWRASRLLQGRWWGLGLALAAGALAVLLPWRVRLRRCRKHTRKRRPAALQFTLAPQDPHYANGAAFG